MWDRRNYPETSPMLYDKVHEQQEEGKKKKKSSKKWSTNGCFRSPNLNMVARTWGFYLASNRSLHTQHSCCDFHTVIYSIINARFQKASPALRCVGTAHDLISKQYRTTRSFTATVKSSKHQPKDESVSFHLQSYCHRFFSTVTS